MKHLSFAFVAACLSSLSLTPPAQAQSNDILSILAHKAETPSLQTPTTIPYAYTLTLDMKNREGKEVTEGQAVVRINPANPAGTRAQIISASDPEDEAFIDFMKEVEDPDRDMAERAEEFWCGQVDEDDEFDPADFEVISETAAEATIRPRAGKLAEILMQSDAPEDKKGRKMQRKLAERIDGEMTLSKPDAQVKGFRVTMTRPLTMMVVAKLKVMDMEQSCSLAPNGFYHISSMQMKVEGKAMGSRFGQELDIQISELPPLP